MIPFTPPIPYGCLNKPKAGEPWKEGGACQHDSFNDPRCLGCHQRRKEAMYIPTGAGK